MKRKSLQKNDFDLTGMIVVFVLCIVTALLYFGRMDILGMPIFVLSISMLFLLIAFRDTTFSHKNVKVMHEIDIYALVLSMLLFFIMFMLFLGNLVVIHSMWFPIIAGAVFIMLAVFDAFSETFRNHSSAKHLNMIAIVGGELMIVYGISMRFHIWDILWTPIYPGLAALALYTMSMGEKAQSITDQFVACKLAKKSLSRVRSDNMDFKLPFEVYSVENLGSPNTMHSTEHSNKPAHANTPRGAINTGSALVGSDPHDFCDMLENARQIRASILRHRT